MRRWRRERNASALLALVALAAACEPVGTIPTPPPPVVVTEWIGVVTTVQFGVLDLRLRVEGQTGTRRGTWTLGANRSGTLLGTIGDDVDIVLTQTSPCAATLTLDGERFNTATEIAGLVTSDECDGRIVEGAFAANIVGEPLEPAARVRGLWDQAYRFGSGLELGVLDLRQIGGLVDGSFRDERGAFVGAAAGVVTPDKIYYVLERASPCVVTRSAAASILEDDTELAGTWRGFDCTGTFISAGTLESQLR